jgi:hypothetical protein
LAINCHLIPDLERVAPETDRPASEKSNYVAKPLGALKESVLHIAADFDAIAEGFEEYVE